MMKLDSKYLVDSTVLEKLNDVHFLREELAKGHVLQQVMGFSDEAMEEFYQVGKRLVEEKRFDDAGDVFYFLAQMTPHVKAFWLGVAHSEWNCKRPEQAIGAFLAAIALDQEDKDTYLECARCFLTIHRPDEALQIMDMALGYADDHPEAVTAHDLREAAVAGREWILKEHKLKR